MSNKARQRRGAVYLIVLGTGMIVSVLGLTALTICRVQRREVGYAQDTAEARLYADAALQIGMKNINRNQLWRTAGITFNNKPVGTGTCTLTAVDPVDGNIPQSYSDPVVLSATGRKGEAVHKLEVRLVPTPLPLGVLNTCLHANDGITVLSGKSVTVEGAPLSSSLIIKNSGTITGSVVCADLQGAAPIGGSVTENAPAKAMPDFDACMNIYVAQATVITPSSGYAGKVLTPGVNTFGGGLNPNGVYYINNPGSDVVIQGCRIHGTLLIKCKKLILDNAVFIQSYRPDYPVLIVEGDAEFSYKTAANGLSEKSWKTNFNPDGAPYEGVTNSSPTDDYPNEVQGLVHIKKTLVMKQTAKVVGVVIVGADAQLTEFNRFVHMPSLFTSPPPGYTTRWTMSPDPATWRQIVN